MRGEDEDSYERTVGFQNVAPLSAPSMLLIMSPLVVLFKSVSVSSEHEQKSIPVLERQCQLNHPMHEQQETASSHCNEVLVSTITQTTINVHSPTNIRRFSTAEFYSVSAKLMDHLNCSLKINNRLVKRHPSLLLSRLLSCMFQHRQRILAEFVFMLLFARTIFNSR